MLIYLSLLILGWLWQGTSGLDKQIFPPADFMNSCIIDTCGSTEGINSSLSGLVMLPLYHLIDISEFVIDLFQDNFVLIVKDSLVFFHFHVHVLYSL